DDALLLDMLIASKKIQSYVDGFSFDDFSKSDLVQSGIIRELQVIGEAARMLSDERKAQHQEIQWRSIAGMRNRLIHEYFNIDLQLVWDTIENDLEPLM